MTSHIYDLGKRLFSPQEWPHLAVSLEKSLPQHTRTLFVDGRLAGFVVVTPYETESHIAYLAYCGVDPAYQGKGFGSKLLKETIQSIFQAEFGSCRLLVDSWNVDARRLYTRLGFQHVAYVQDAMADF